MTLAISYSQQSSASIRASYRGSTHLVRSRFHLGHGAPVAPFLSGARFRGSLVGEALPNSPRGNPGSRARPEHVPDPLDVSLCGAFGDEEPLPDLAIGHTDRDQLR